MYIDANLFCAASAKVTRSLTRIALCGNGTAQKVVTF